MRKSLLMILAGGRGSRLGPLTCHRAKPAVPFGGRYRIIDFVLSNAIHSGYSRIYVLTQYMAASLIRHLNRTWHLSGPDQFVEIAPAQMRRGEHWYLGTADSVAQNINLINDNWTEHIGIFGGDHIYKFNVGHMEDFHRSVSADLTIAAFPVPIDQAHQFGVIQVNAKGRILGFQEKPTDPTPIPGQPGTCLVSMGNYFFRTRVLTNRLQEDAANQASSHDFGKDIIPAMVSQGQAVYAYDFTSQKVPGDPVSSQPYWRDVGTIDSYFEANMDLRTPEPMVQLYNRQWPIVTAQRNYPPARFFRGPHGSAVDLDEGIVCEGTIIEGAQLRKAILGYDCLIRDGASLTNCLLLSGCHVGPRATLQNVLLDKNCAVEAGARIGLDPRADRQRFPFITKSGLVVFPKGTYIPREGPIELASDIAEMIAVDPSLRRDLQKLAVPAESGRRNRHSSASAGPRSGSHKMPKR